MATPTSLPATFVAGNVLTAAQMNDLRGAFRILQVVSTTKDDTFSASLAGNASTAVTGLTATITPSSTASKILVISTVVAANSFGPGGVAPYSLTRDATLIAQPASPGSRLPLTNYTFGGNGATVMASATAVYLDSPASTSSLVYGVSLFNAVSSTETVYVNRADSDTDASTRRRTVSSITVREVSA
jgi:hypothetical protein